MFLSHKRTYTNVKYDFKKQKKICGHNCRHNFINYFNVAFIHREIFFRFVHLFWMQNQQKTLILGLLWQQQISMKKNTNTIV